MSGKVQGSAATFLGQGQEGGGQIIRLCLWASISSSVI